MSRTIPLLLWIYLLLLAPLAVAAEPSFVKGVHYQPIRPPLPISQPGKVVVMEMFWYGCPHCFHFEPILEEWVEEKPENVVFMRTPAVFRDIWKLHARAFYTAKALGILDQAHDAIFNAIHREGRRLNSKEALAEFFTTLGVAKEDFLQTFNSFGVKLEVQQAIEMTIASGITGVPAMIVDGKYRTDAGMAGGFKRMLKVVDYLVAKESANASAQSTAKKQ